MAYAVTGTGVDFTRGRGAAKVTLSISFKELEKWAKANKVDTEKLMKMSFFRAIKGLKDKFAAVMRAGGGVYGVPKFKDFEDFTKELRRIRGDSKPIGGMLAEKSSVYGSKGSNRSYIIGWKDYLEKAAKKFQEGEGGAFAESQFTDSDYRKYWHRLGVRDVPRAYVHNERMVLPEPFGDFVREKIDEWARGAFYTELARQMQKARAA